MKRRVKILRGTLGYPDHKVGYAIFDRAGALVHRGSFQLDDYDARRAFAIRANDATMAGQEVRTWSFRDDPERYNNNEQQPQKPAEPHVHNRKVTGPDEHGSVYVYFQNRHFDGVVAESVEHDGSVVVDYDANGKLYGIELLDIGAYKLRRKS